MRSFSVPDLDGGSPLRGGLVELLGGHGGPVDTVPPCLGADVDDGVAHPAGAAEEDLVASGDPEVEDIHQGVAVVALVEEHLSPDCRHPHAVAVARYACHHSLDEIAVARLVEGPEAKGVHGGDASCAHGEDVAKDASHARGGPLVGLDEGGVVVGLHLEDRNHAVTDVDDARILPRPLDYGGTTGGQLLQVDLAGLVGAVLGPHDGEDAEFGEGGLPPQDLLHPLKVLRREAVLGHQPGSYLGIRSHRPCLLVVAVPSETSGN